MGITEKEIKLFIRFIKIQRHKFYEMKFSINKHTFLSEINI